MEVWRETAGRAVGKAVLVGEHFVVFGGTALAVPVRSANLMVRIRATRRERNRVVLNCDLPHPELVSRAAAVGVRSLIPRAKRRIDVTAVEANFPAASGLGASAAFSVAFSRAVQALFKRADEDMVAQVALDMEHVFHRTPSGIDSTTVAFSTPCYVKTGATYVNGDSAGPSAGFLDIAPGAVFLLADSGERSNTLDVQKRLDEFLNQRKGNTIMEKLVAVSETISLQSANALRKGDFEYVGTMFNENHYLLQALKVSTSRLDRLRLAALDAGALGAKLTGSGCGGFLLTICHPDARQALRKALQKQGVTVFFEQPTDDL